MSKIPVQLEGTYTFVDYFKLTYETEDILNLFRSPADLEALLRVLVALLQEGD